MLEIDNIPCLDSHDTAVNALRKWLLVIVSAPMLCFMTACLDGICTAASKVTGAMDNLFSTVQASDCCGMEIVL